MPESLTRHPWLLIVGGAVLLSFGLPYVMGEAEGGVPPLPLAGALITVMVPAGFIAFGQRRRSVVSGLVLLGLALAAGVIVVWLIETDSLELGGLIVALFVLTLLAGLVVIVLAALLVRLVVNAVRRRRGAEPAPEPAAGAGASATPRPRGDVQATPEAGDHHATPKTGVPTRRVAWLAASGAAAVVLVLGLIEAATVHGFVTDKILPALSTFGGAYAIITGALNRRR